MPCHFAVDRIAALSRGVPGLTHRVDDLALDHPAVAWIANCPSRTARRTTCPAKQQPAVEAAKTAGGAEQSHYTPTVTFRETKKDRTRLVLSRPSGSEFASSHIGFAHGRGSGGFLYAIKHMTTMESAQKALSIKESQRGDEGD